MRNAELKADGTGRTEPSDLSTGAEELVRRYSSAPGALSPEEVQRLVYEFQVQLGELETQNQELRERQRSLERYRDRYVDLYDFAPLGYVSLDEDAYVQEINLAGAKMLGLEPAEITGYSFVDYVTPAHRDSFLRHVRECVRELKEVTGEVILTAPDGQTIPVQLHSLPISDEDGKSTLCKTAVTDITERKLAEEALRRAKEDWEGTFDTVPDLVAILDSHHRVVRVNRAMAERFKVSPDECIGLRCYELMHGSSQPSQSCPHAQTCRDGREHTVELEEPRLAGSFLVTTSPRLDEQGRAVGTVHVARDITRLKQTEKALHRLNAELEGRVAEQTAEIRKTYDLAQAERQRLYDLLETLPVYVILLSTDHHVPFANRFFRERFGESQGRRCFEYLFQRTEPCESCETYKVLKTGAPHQWEWTGPDGRDYDIYDFPFVDSDGSRLILEMGIDVTERKRAEAALRASQARLIRAQRVASVGVWEWEIATGELYWSDGIYHIFGLEKDQFPATYDAFIASVHPDDRDFVQRHVDRAVHQNAEYSIDHRIVLPGGEVRYVHEQGEVHRDADGKPLGMLGTVLDITDRKQAEEDLRETKQRLELAVRGTYDGLWDWNVITNEVWFAPRFNELLGYQADELPNTFAAWESRLHPDDRGRTLEAVQLHLEQGRPYDVEYRLRIKSGDYRWFRARGEAVRDECGIPFRMAGSIEDIAQRKDLERELSEISTFEQQRMGQELHDGLGQQMLGLRLLAKGLEKSLLARGFPEAGSASQLVEALHDCQKHIRALIEGVRPVEVDANGLMAALANLAENTQTLTDIAFTFVCHRPVLMEDTHTATQLFYIAQEAVRNAVKHAKPTRITVRLESHHGQVTLAIRDDGRGIHGDPDQMTGMGLRIMRYRAGVLGAALRIQPAVGGGTLVTCTLHQEQRNDSER